MNIQVSGKDPNPPNMADVRALLAAERQSRRIAHPLLSYTKSGVLLCNVCNLNVKSETLWEGHLRSANHRKNALASQETTAKPLKRKHEDDENVPQEDRSEADRDGRKKPKSRSVTLTSTTGEEPKDRDGQSLPTEPNAQPPSPPPSAPTAPTEPDLPPQSQALQPNGTQAQAEPEPEVDEDEWAAFEREVAPLTAATQPTHAASYAAATITAAPVTAAQIAQQADEEKRRRLDTEADDEKEDEGRRLEEEFDVMEEMEERVRKLREKREALRHVALVTMDGADKDQKQQPTSSKADGRSEAALPYDESANLFPNENHDHDNNHDDDDDDDEDDEDDWYR